MVRPKKTAAVIHRHDRHGSHGRKVLRFAQDGDKTSYATVRVASSFEPVDAKHPTCAVRVVQNTLDMSPEGLTCAFA